MERKYNPFSEETFLPPEDALLPPETAPVPADEFAGKSNPAPKEEGSSHSRLKKMILMPAVATLAAVSVLFSSLNFDPIGTDVFNGSSASSPAATGDVFPSLPNLAPDFAGDYAWSGSGSEEYVRLIPSGGTSYAYLQAGSVWVGMGAAETAVPGATYDKTTNTLTLENFSAAVLDVNLMGNGFTVRLIGDNTLDQLTVWGAGYGGSVLLTGTGTLTVNQNGAAPDGVGIRLNAEGSASCLMVDKGVTVDVYGSPAVLVSDTALEQGIFYLSPTVPEGGVRSRVGVNEYEGKTYYTFSVTDETGAQAKHVRFVAGGDS